MKDVVRKARELAESGDIGGASETVFELLEHVKELKEERDAALERVRVLEQGALLAVEVAKTAQFYIASKKLFAATRGVEKDKKGYYIAAANWKHASFLLESKVFQYLTGATND